MGIRSLTVQRIPSAKVPRNELRVIEDHRRTRGREVVFDAGTQRSIFRPEELGKILQQHLGFPRWRPRGA